MGEIDYRAVFQNSGCGQLVLNMSSHVVDCNRLWIDTLAASKSDVVARSIFALAVPACAQRVQRYVWLQKKEGCDGCMSHPILASRVAADFVCVRELQLACPEDCRAAWRVPHVVIIIADCPLGQNVASPIARSSRSSTIV